MHKQQGMGLFSLLFYIVLIIFISTVVSRLGPLYLENYKIDLILNTVKEQFDHQPITSLNETQIRNAIEKRFEIEDLNKELLSAIKIASNPQGILVKYQYEPRKNLFFNIDVVINFQKQFQIEKQ